MIVLVGNNEFNEENMMHLRQICSWVVAPLFALFLVACGGGSVEKQSAYPYDGLALFQISVDGALT